MRFLLPIATIAGALIAACGSPLSPAEVLALREAEARWAARSFQAYSFETRAGCFCDPITLQWVRVEVSGDSVTRVVVLDTGLEVGLPERSYFPSVERLFAMIRNARDGDGVKDVEAEYDRDLGYPTFIDIVPNDNIVDGGRVQYARKLTATP